MRCPRRRLENSTRSCCEPEKPVLNKPEAPNTYVTMGVGRVRVRIVGQGAPLLLLMGIGGHLDMWRPLADRLPQRQLVMFDFPGTGGSSLPWFPPTMAFGALFVRKLLQRLG